VKARRKRIGVADYHPGAWPERPQGDLIILDPEARRLVIYWHHASEPTEDVPFFSRHFRMFDDADKAQHEPA
jgi:hypothetical protein